MERLEEICKDIRKKILKMNFLSGSGHLTSSYSSVELIVTLYLGDVMKYDSTNLEWEDRDFFVLSKGHAAMAYYSVLCKAGFLSEEELWTFCEKGTRLGGHPNIKIPGVEATTGSLGHGLSLAAGIGIATKIKGKNNKVFCITGDGELQEGSNWEAAMFIANNKLCNVVWIVDYNKIQLAGKLDDIMTLGDLKHKIESFGFTVLEVNGHDCGELLNAYSKKSDRPIAIIANTEKGHGAPSIANKTGWHGKKPNLEELKIILNEIGMSEEDLKR